MKESIKAVGLILSAGFSSRMKEFKPLMKIGEKNSIEILADNFRLAGIEDIYIVVGYNKEFIVEFLEKSGYLEENPKPRHLFEDPESPEVTYRPVRVVENPDFEDGMFTSVKAGVRAAKADGFDCVLMTPVDIPMIPPYIIRETLRRAENNPDFFTVPCYEGKKGHPLCIPMSYADEILGSAGENGLKSVTSQHEDRFIKFATHCEGIIIDMDTQEAYRRLVEFYNINKYPSEEKVRRMYERAETPSHIIKHCEAVTDTAIAIAEALNAKGYRFDVPLLRAAGLMHDILRIKKKHWEEGAMLALDYGYPEVAELVDAHMNYVHPLPIRSITEKDILCLADKLRQEDRLVTLEDRLAPAVSKFADDPEVLGIIRGKIDAANETMKFIEEIIGVKVYDLLAEADRKKAEAAGEKPAPRRLILIRHGEIMKHKDKIFLGQKDVPLSVEGREQCTFVGMELQHFDVKTDKVYSSDLNRAMESASIIAGILGDSFEVVPVPEFREMNLGHWDGLYITDIKEQFGEEYEKRGRDLINYKIDEEAENFPELQARVMKRLNALIDETEGDIILVSHSGVNRVIKCALLGKDLDALKTMKFQRGTYEILELPEKK